MKTLLLAISLLFLSHTLFAEELKISAKEHWPYTTKMKKKKQGYTYDILRAIYGEQYDVKLDVFPWARAMLNASLNKNQAIVGIHKTPENEKAYIFPKRTIGMTGNAFFVLKNSDWEYQGLPSLETIKLGIVKDVEYGSEFEPYFKKNTKNYDRLHIAKGTDALDLNLRLLTLGKLNAVFDDTQTILSTANTMKIGSQIKAVGFDNTNPIYVAFSKQFPQAQALADRYDTQIVKMRQSGELDRILFRYAIEDWK